MKKDIAKYATEDITTLIVTVRGKRVILDRDLARLYGTNTKRQNEQVKRNRNRFPGDFMFRLTMEEAKVWWAEVRGGSLRSQIVTF